MPRSLRHFFEMNIVHHPPPTADYLVSSVKRASHSARTSGSANSCDSSKVSHLVNDADMKTEWCCVNQPEGKVLHLDTLVLQHGGNRLVDLLQPVQCAVCLIIN